MTGSGEERSRPAAALTGGHPLAAPRSGRRAVAAALLDLVCVLAFVLAGRRSHDEGTALAGIAETAWPFLAGLGLAWLVLRAWRRPTRLWPTAVLTWLITVAVGLGLRILAGQGASGAFPLVAAGVLALLLVGWRLLARALRLP